MKQTSLAIVVASLLIGSSAAEELPRMNESLHSWLKQRAGEFAAIPRERQSDLTQLAKDIISARSGGETARLTFICTHNSRRSHLAQIWAAGAARYYGIQRVETYSGGTETTAFNPRAIAAVERTGVMVTRPEMAGTNPRYEVRFHEADEPLICFSKVYNDPANPASGFGAIMTCDQADRACPMVAGASFRIALPYRDPKVSDGTPEEAATYDERSRQIAREMLYLFFAVQQSQNGFSR